MAVRAQFPSNALLRNGYIFRESFFNLLPFSSRLPATFSRAFRYIECFLDSRKRRVESEIKSEEMATNCPPHLLSVNEGDLNQKKRARVTPPPMALEQQQHIAFSLLSPTILGLSSHQSATPLVSTGLRLALDGQKHYQIKEEESDSLISEDIAAHIINEDYEINQLITAQGKQLMRALAESQQRHYRTLLEYARKCLLNKEAEMERAGRCNALLKDRLTRTQTESMEWQAKAMAEQSAAASLHAQLQKATVAAAAAPGAAECCGELPVEDAGSAYVDPDRFETPERPCQACHRRPAMVVLFPCSHLCVCVVCDSAGAVGEGCPVCGCYWTRSLQVSLA